MITFSQLGRYGRFANGLFQIAGVIGIATKSGQPFSFPQFINWDHKERFGSTEDVELYKFFENELPAVPALHFEARYIHWGYHDVYLPAGNWDLSGHFQSFRYFEHCEDVVRHYLKMKPLCEPLEPGTCAVHWRAGDYIPDPGAYHPRMPISYYREAMARVNCSRFVVFSDDIKAAKLMFGSDVEYAEGNDYITDFYLMTTADHFIIANSSYSAMAAWLSGCDQRNVVSPTGQSWFGPVAGINGDDIIHKDWQTIDVRKLIMEAA